MNVEKLIDCVRARTILYDITNEDYKNVALKGLIWENIAKDLNQNCDAVKQKWKTIRDGYYKNKKQVKESTGKIVTHYVWSQQLRFLDDFKVNRKSTTKVKSSAALTGQSSPGSSVNQVLIGQQPSISQGSTKDPLASQPPSRHSSPPPAELSPAQRQDFTKTPQPSPIVSSSSPPFAFSQLPQHKENEDIGDVARILQYLTNKTENTDNGIDAIDHLFLSYAKTLKKFSPVLQAEVKLELAKLFSEAELKELQNTIHTSTARHSNPNSSTHMTLAHLRSQVHYNSSPSYAVISTDSIPQQRAPTQQVVETTSQNINMDTSLTENADYEDNDVKIKFIV